MPASPSHSGIVSLLNCGLRREPGCALTSAIAPMPALSSASRKTPCSQTQCPMVQISSPLMGPL